MHKNITKFYLYTICHSFIFAYVIERLFWAERGMRIIDVVYCEIIYSAVVLLLELPTGMFADRFSRKTWIVLDAFMALIEFTILIFASGFWHFALAIGLSAIGHAFQSGAHNALLYDTLATTNHTERFEEILGRLKALDYGGVIIGSLIGAFIATRAPLVTTYWISLVSLVLAFFISLTIEEVTDSHHDDTPWTMKDWWEILRFMMKTQSIGLLVIVGMITGAAISYLDEFWQIYLSAIKVPVIWFGPFQVLSFGAVALGSLFAYRHKERFGLKPCLETALFTAATAFLITALVRHWAAFIFVAIIYYAMAVTEPLIYGYLHDQALPKYRATIESAFSFLVMFSVIVAGLPFGWLSTTYSIFIGFIYLSALLILAAVLYGVTARWQHENE